MSNTLIRRQVSAAAIFLSLLAALPLLVGDFYLSVLGLVFLHAIVGIAWNLMMGYAGQLSLGHALYFGVGAYVVAILSERFGVTPWVGMVIAFAIAALLGLAVGALGFRFAVKGVYFALLTIAFAEFARILFEHWDAVGKTGGFFLGALTPANKPLLTLRGGAMFFYYALLITMALAWLASMLLVNSRLGYAWRAIREDEDAARAIGVEAFRMKLIAVAISAGITGIAGGWFALINGSLFPDSVLGMRLSIDLIVAPIVGGLGTLFGPILGALIIVPLNELSRELSQSASINGLNLLIYGVLLLAVVIIAPHGCWPWHRPAARPRRTQRQGALMTILEVRGLTKRFAGLVAVDDVSFDVARGSITALIGPNGAGKTTCFSMIAGALKPTSGTVVFAGHDIVGHAPEALCRQGLARTFQIVRPLAGMSVLDNVVVGALAQARDVASARSDALAVLKRVGLDAKSAMPASALTLPDRKMLELAKALATKPRLLLLDEVMAGLRSAEADKITAVLRQLNGEGLTIVLIEHVMRVVMALAETVIVLNYGKKIAQGTPAAVVADRHVIESYLGTKAAAQMRPQ